jgi:phosphoserine phosphatase RsbU/P
MTSPALQRPTISARLTRFWRRITEGLEINQLWTQFQADARTSYHLYSREVDFARPHDVAKGRHFFNVVRQFFWAVVEQISPARRVLLLVALVLVVLSPEASWHDREGSFHVIGFDFRLVGALVLLLLLFLEVADRVVMKRDLQIAREIQSWLLPSSPPQPPGIDIAFAARPANTVAGDYYDVFPRLPDSSSSPVFLFAVADVAGKSIPAALLMASFQASLKTIAATPSTLNQLVDGLNRYVCTNSQGGRRFITAFIAEFAPNDRTFTYINAGHNPPLLRRSSGAIVRLEAGGIPLGIQEGAEYQLSQVTLDSGDWLAIFTDGLVEAANERGEEYGEQRVISLLQGGSQVPATNVISQLMVGLDLFVGGNLPLADDVTCVLVHVL